jgi:hypothetical protein
MELGVRAGRVEGRAVFEWKLGVSGVCVCVCVARVRVRVRTNRQARVL